MGRSHAWTVRGRERIDRRPSNWGKNLTMVGAIRLTGPVMLRTQFATTNGERFVKYVRELAPKLNAGDILVLDNVRAHHDPRVAPILKRRGIRLKYLRLIHQTSTPSNRLGPTPSVTSGRMLHATTPLSDASPAEHFEELHHTIVPSGSLTQDIGSPSTELRCKCGQT